GGGGGGGGSGDGSGNGPGQGPGTGVSGRQGPITPVSGKGGGAGNFGVSKDGLIACNNDSATATLSCLLKDKPKDIVTLDPKRSIAASKVADLLSDAITNKKADSLFFCVQDGKSFINAVLLLTGTDYYPITVDYKDVAPTLDYPPSDDPTAVKGRSFS